MMSDHSAGLPEQSQESQPVTAVQIDQPSKQMRDTAHIRKTLRLILLVSLAIGFGYWMYYSYHSFSFYRQALRLVGPNRPNSQALAYQLVMRQFPFSPAGLFSRLALASRLISGTIGSGALVRFPTLGITRHIDLFVLLLWVTASGTRFVFVYLRNDRSNVGPDIGNTIRATALQTSALLGLILVLHYVLDESYQVMVAAYVWLAVLIPVLLVLRNLMREIRYSSLDRMFDEDGRQILPLRPRASVIALSVLIVTATVFGTDMLHGSTLLHSLQAVARGTDAGPEASAGPTHQVRSDVRPNYRSGPGTDSDIIGVLEPSSFIGGIEQRHGWVRFFVPDSSVENPEPSGWVWGEFLIEYSE